MDLDKIVRKKISNIIKESILSEKTFEADVNAYSEKTGKDYIVYGIMDYEPSDELSEGSGRLIKVYKIVSNDGVVIANVPEMDEIFTKDDWKVIFDELENKLNKQADSYENQGNELNLDNLDENLAVDVNRKKGIKEYIQEEILKFHQKTLLELKKIQIENELKILKENI